MATRVIKLKKRIPEINLQSVEKIIKLTNDHIQPVLNAEPVNSRRVIKISKYIVPPIPGPSVHLTMAMEAFESIREYYTQRGLRIPQSDIKWYYQELAEEKKEYDAFWTRCAATKACIDGTLRGDDNWTIDLAVNAARQAEKKLPIQESDIGPMPEYGSGEFWAWCRKRKLLKEQKEAAIIAAGGTVPVAKVQKAVKGPKKLKAQELQKP
jgi:hypothetical protein